MKSVFGKVSALLGFMCLVLTVMLFSGVEAEAVSFDEVATLYINGKACTSSAFTATNIKCGTTTTFTVDAHSPKGTRQRYYLNGIITSSGDLVTDVTKYSYQDDNTFRFTFMASGTYKLKFYIMDYGVVEDGEPGTKAYYKTWYITIKDPAYPSVDTIAQNVVNRCIAAGCKTDYEKALWLHDWIVANCKYDYSMLYCGTEGALARGTGTCESYYKGYSLLLSKAGIENCRVDSTQMFHVWTGMKLDGYWYQTDCTWDAEKQDDLSKRMYFCLPTEIMCSLNSRDKDTKFSTEGNRDKAQSVSLWANSYKNNYFIKSGNIHYWTDPLISDIQNELNKGKKSFRIDVTQSKYKPQGINYYNSVYEYNKVMYALAAYSLNSKKWYVNGNRVFLKAKFVYTNPINSNTTEGASSTLVFTAEYPVSVSAPSGKNFTYNGTTRTGVSSGTGYTLGGTFSAKNAGTYTATAKLNSGYVWSDGTKSDKTIKWTISKKSISGGYAMSLSFSKKTYTGSALIPEVVIKNSSGNVLGTGNYTVSCSNNISPGTATVKAVGKGNYTGSVTKTFSITPKTPSVSSWSNRSTGIRLNIKTVTGASGYLVFRYDSTQNAYVKIGKTSGNYYIDKSAVNASNGKKFIYKVQAYTTTSTGTLYSLKSSAVSTWRIKAPSAFSAAAYSGYIKLNFSKPSSVAYTIYRSTSSGGTYTALKTISSSSGLTYCKDTSAVKGKTYYYKIRAYRIINEKRVYSAYTDIISATAR
ncbi:MAG: transglutaminase-like domain-containing protein [Clostridia bacterium]|nr:transglutaminase-like domain-containing protein [Clostridia bacterium]